MAQYCRYCAFCFDMIGVYGCSKNSNGKELYMSRKEINKANKCKNFALTDLGDVETGKQYKPRTYKPRQKTVKREQIAIEEVLKC